jgi:hypothetical protein
MPTADYIKKIDFYSNRRNGSQASTLTALSQFDNGILFLDNDERIYDPKNIKTPPAPKWGEPLEEDNWDPTEDFFNEEKAKVEMERRKEEAMKNYERMQRANKSQPLNSNLYSSAQQRTDGADASRRSQAGSGSKRLKLKRRVIYTYEEVSDDENQEASAKKLLDQSTLAANTLGQVGNQTSAMPFAKLMEQLHSRDAQGSSIVRGSVSVSPKFKKPPAHPGLKNS